MNNELLFGDLLLSYRVNLLPKKDIHVCPICYQLLHDDAKKVEKKAIIEKMNTKLRDYLASFSTTKGKASEVAVDIASYNHRRRMIYMRIFC